MAFLMQILRDTDLFLDIGAKAGAFFSIGIRCGLCYNHQDCTDTYYVSALFR
ncbi:MAG: hypothetical protein QNK20_09025 [Aureibaculum sp.]|nr:hypothetical protein [Aureibaculum sp.]